MAPRMNRREFLAAAAAAGAAAVAGAEAAGVPTAAAGQIKVGLIGCGGRGTSAALQAVRADSAAVLWSMGDLFGDRLQASIASLDAAIDKGAEAHSASEIESWRRRTRVPPERRFHGFDAYQRVIASGADVVLLATPPAFRPEHLRAAVEAGKHIFAEKPVAVDAPGVRSVLESAQRARERGLCLVSGFCWRYNARDRETHALLRAGAIGDIRAIYTTYNAQGWNALKRRQPEWTDSETRLRNWHYDVRLSGDHIVEQAVHMIDKINWLKGPPARCTAVGGAQARADGPEWCNIYDHFSVTYEYDDGTRAFHMCRHWPNTTWDNRDYIIGANGVCRVNPWAGDYEIESGRHTWKCEVKRNNMYQQELDELFAAIRAGEPINDGEWMAHSTLMAIMGRNAAYTGRTITWDEALNDEEALIPESWEVSEFPPRYTPVPGRTTVTSATAPRP